MNPALSERQREPDVTIFDVFPAGWWHLSHDERHAAVDRARMRQRRRIRRRERRAKRRAERWQRDTARAAAYWRRRGLGPDGRPVA